VDQLFPDWKIFEQFVHDDFGRAQSLDGLVSSHPIEVPIAKASEVDEIFDAISYSKGCAVIRMLVEYLGLETFRQGLLIYLARHKFANASSDDLWKALSESSKQDVKGLMHSWIRQTGYPVVTVTVDKVENGKRYLTLEQYRYLDSGRPENDTTQWIIPFGYITSENPNKPHYILMKDRKQTIEVNDNIQWIKFNPTQTGFYRVQYPAEYYKSLRTAIENQSMPPIDRLGVIEDAMALARAGYLPTASALEILSAFSNETNYTVWSSVSSAVDSLYNIVKDEDWYSSFETFARNIFKKKGTAFGWDPKANESHLDSLLRVLLIADLAFFKDKDTIHEGQQRFAKFLKDQSAVVADLRGTLYSIAIRNGGKAEYEQVLEIFRKSDLNEEKNRCLKSLGTATDVELLKRTLDFALSSEVRSQDVFYVLNTVATNPLSVRLTWEWFKQNFEDIKKRYEGGFIIGRIVKISISGFVKEKDAAEVEEFFKQHPLPNAQRSISQGLETLRLNAKWLERDRENIKKWLTSHQQ
jgi:puromycin-sensitive aminopeptidase